MRLYLAINLMFAFTVLIGQSQEPIKTISLEDDFAKGMSYLDRFQNDSANFIFTKLIQELSISNELETPFGLRVQLRQAEVLEKDDQNEIAILQLLKIETLCEQKKQWDVCVNADLSLARIHEKMDQPDKCYADLQRARKLLQLHQLDSIYPRFAIRQASYHRLFSRQLDSAKFYAHEVLRTAPLFEQDEHEAVGHLLLGLLFKDSSYKLAIEHFEKSGAVWLRIGDYSGYQSIQQNLAWVYLQNHQAQRALAHSDTALLAISKAYRLGHEYLPMLVYGYKRRAKIFKELQQLDSTWYYLQKSHELELKDLRTSSHAEVIEIEARYHDDIKNQQLVAQQQRIQLDEKRKVRLWSMLFLILFLGLILAYLYVKLRKAKQSIDFQSVALFDNNQRLVVALEQQQLLQGEIHHRVKNNLQVIISLLELQKEDIDDLKARESLESMANRIFSIAAIHELLYQENETTMVNLAEYTANLCAHFTHLTTQQNQPDFSLDIGDKYFNLATLMPIGIILNELLTNSLKYGTHLSSQLKISIDLVAQKDGYCINYRDNGPGFPLGHLQAREGGLGTYLLTSMSRQLHGHMKSHNDNGAVYTIFFKEKKMS